MCVPEIVIACLVTLWLTTGVMSHRLENLNLAIERKKSDFPAVGYVWWHILGLYIRGPFAFSNIMTEMRHQHA